MEPLQVKYLRLRQYIPLLHELSFSVYIALLAVTAGTFTEGSILNRWGYPQLYRLLLDLHWQTGFVFGRYVLPDLLWGSLTLVFFVCLRLLDRAALMRPLVPYMTGIAIVATFPLMWFNWGYLGYFLRTAWWLPVEGAAVVSCVFVYVLRGWPANAVLDVSVLTLHFVLWRWVATWRGPLVGDELLFPLLGVGAGVAWGWHVRLCVRSHPQATLPAV
ncbi:MAG TPA: hypothetical protein VLY04_19010 [Bryobacteraceae bacterium]|nr:hypothetical protein [Bryobacteraceae bacterium]